MTCSTNLVFVCTPLSFVRSISVCFNEFERTVNERKVTYLHVKITVLDFSKKSFRKMATIN